MNHIGIAGVQRMPRIPVETDFVIAVHPTTIEIMFIPTGSNFTFHRSIERKDIVDLGPVSPDARVRWNSRKRATAIYSTWEVQAMAFRLAFEAVSRDDATKGQIKRRQV
jgi:hypothetical protein